MKTTSGQKRFTPVTVIFWSTKTKTGNRLRTMMIFLINTENLRKEYYSLQFQEYFDIWDGQGHEIDNICSKVICRSCFDKRKD